MEQEEEGKITRKDDPRTLAIRRSLYRKIRQIIRDQKLRTSAIAYMIRANNNLGRNLVSNQDISLYSFIKMMQLLGFEITISKADVPFNWKDDKVYVQRYEKHKNKQRDAQRRKRGLPEGELPTKIRIKRESDGKYIEIVNRRKLEAEQREQNDLFSTARSSNAL